MMEYMFIFTIMLISFVIFYNLFRNKDGLPTNWPLVGMLPALLTNLHRLNDFCIELMEKSNMTFHLKGPWFTNMHLVFVGDPANIDHVLCKNFKGYVTGSKLKEALEPLGDGILLSDSSIWNYHRKVAHSFFSHPHFHHSLVNITWKKIEIGLIPVLDHFSDRGVEIDLKDVFSRFMYDAMCILMMDHDPLFLSINLHDFPLIKAVNNFERTAVSRHAVPTWVWKLQRWLNVGEEKQVKKWIKILDDFIYKCIDLKKEQLSEGGNSTPPNQGIVDLLTLFMNEDENKKPPISCTDKYLRDTIANFFLAGVETTSAALCWFFYLLSKNPLVVHNIKVELDASMIKMKDNDGKFVRNFEKLSSKLVYLHAALCESLRLYPSIPFDPKTPSKPDILPSGHQVNPNTQIIFCLYAMGRTKSIWGVDCNEFKPERWISKGDGMIKHEPSNKFSVFGSGPRACIGKQMAFTQMKILSAFLIQNYHIEAIKKDQVPDVAIVLHMKDEFKVRVYRS